MTKFCFQRFPALVKTERASGIVQLGKTHLKRNSVILCFPEVEITFLRLADGSVYLGNVSSNVKDVGLSYGLLAVLLAILWLLYYDGIL